MNNSDTRSGWMPFTMLVMLVILQFNYVNCTEPRTGDYTTWVKKSVFKADRRFLDLPKTCLVSPEGPLWLYLRGQTIYRFLTI